MIVLDRGFVARSLPERPDDAHKGTMGTLCSITGSAGCSGAAILSARSALRSGVGLHLQILTKPIYPIFASSVPESVCIPVDGSFTGSLSRADIPTIMNAVERSTAVLIGCGMGNTPDTLAVLEEVVRDSKAPLIIDADGINALSRNIDILKEREGEIILTPHIKEFSRLSGLSVQYIVENQEKAASDFVSGRSGMTLVLKSHRTVIACEGEVYLNKAGNSGMAKGGSGDVLAGIIASLAAQGAEPLRAAAAGVHIHALAGDLAASRLGKTSMLPSDIIEALPEVFMSFND